MAHTMLVGLFIDGVIERSNYDMKFSLAKTRGLELTGMDYIILKDCELNTKCQIHQYKTSTSQYTNEQVHTIFNEGVELQSRHASQRLSHLIESFPEKNDLLPPEFAQQQQQYIKYCCDALLDSLGRPRIYFIDSIPKGVDFSTKSNPFHEQDPNVPEIFTSVNFFEASPKEYSSSHSR